MTAHEKPKPDQKHLAWAIEERAEIQRTLLAIYNYVRANQPQHLDAFARRMLDHLAGAAFSLWRAVFLAETFRNEVDIHGSLEKFLEKLITDNAIGFGDDKENRNWTVGYYLENAKLRLASACMLYDLHKKDRARAELLPFLRLRGIMSMGLTRYEWESAHYVLRRLFNEVAPDFALVEPKKPTTPEPEGLELFFVDKEK